MSCWHPTFYVYLLSGGDIGCFAFVFYSTSRFVKETVHEFCGLNAIRWAKHMTSERPPNYPLVSFTFCLCTFCSYSDKRALSSYCAEFHFKRWKRSPRRIVLGDVECAVCEACEGSIRKRPNWYCICEWTRFLQNFDDVTTQTIYKWRTKCNLCFVQVAQAWMNECSKCVCVFKSKYIPHDCSPGHLYLRRLAAVDNVRFSGRMMNARVWCAFVCSFVFARVAWMCEWPGTTVTAQMIIIIIIRSQQHHTNINFYPQKIIFYTFI